MATIVVKGVPVELRRRLEEAARRNGRSLSREVVARLQGVAGREGAAPEGLREQLEAIRALREQIASQTTARITNEEIDRLKRQGRP